MNQDVREHDRIENPVASDLYSFPEAAKYLNLSVWQVRRLVWNGHLDVVEFPGIRKQLLRRASLDLLVKRSTTNKGDYGDQ